MDYKNPDYAGIMIERMNRLAFIRKKPEVVDAMKAHYLVAPWDMISDWGVTFDPREVEVGRPGTIPMVLWPKQVELIQAIIDQWRDRKPMLIEKSRDWGVSWCFIGLSCVLCLQYDGMEIGFGSRKAEYVDKTDDMKALFPKARRFMEYLPAEFRGGHVPWRDAPYMRMRFPETGSMISGEAGKGIGRGDRKGIYFVDESAHLENPMSVENSLSQTTNCRIDVSSVNGPTNPFAKKASAGKIRKFVCDWRDDPRKDKAWYDKQVYELDPVTVAQEIDRDYNASALGILIPAAWIQSSIDALRKLGIAPTGTRTLGFDVADEGLDKLGAVGGQGVEVDYVEEWSGKGADIFTSTEHVFNVCDEFDYAMIRYDGDGLGAGVRGDATIINQQRRKVGRRVIAIEAFRGSDGVWEPEKEEIKGFKNVDRYANRKAQSWWWLRERFKKTHRWVTGDDEGHKIPCNADEIVSISSKCARYLELVDQLKQPTYAMNGVGKILVNKTPPGTKSPNLADAAMIKFSTVTKAPMIVTGDMLARAAAAGRGRRR